MTIADILYGLIEKARGLGKNELIEKNQTMYSTKKLIEYDIKKPSPKAINVLTLTGLVDYVKSNLDKHASDKLMIHVKSPTSVFLYSALRDDASREMYIMCEPDLPYIPLNEYMSTEKFVISLQSCFVQSQITASLLQVIGNVKEETVKQTGDDGVSQSVTAKSGIATVSQVIVPNPVILAPFRTFQEVQQPESKFVLRMKDGPQAALFEGDGGAWRNEAMLNIKEFLKKELAGQPVEIIA